MTEDRWSNQMITERIGSIRERMSAAAAAAGRSPEDITLMAVTKTIPAQVVNLAFGAGVRLFGENRAQELLERREQYCFDSSAIHFIGKLQSNKVRQIIDKVSCIQSVDSLSLAQEIAKRARQADKTMPIMLEVNIGGEASKAGFAPAETAAAVEKTAALQGITVCGLMTIPPKTENLAETQRYFDQMYKLFVDIKHKKIDNSTMVYLSMGMSGDYETAIRAGANLVRVGSGIFGTRIYPKV